jgi:putative PEP-CTERM system histidine kinase
MIFGLPAMVLLHAGCAALYGVLAALILVRQKRSRTGLWLASACLVTAVWAIAVAIDWRSPLDDGAGWLELARSAAWYGFILHLYRRSTSQRRQLMQVFTTLGLVAILVVGGMPLFDLLLGYTNTPLWPASTLGSLSTAAHLGFAVANILLIENLYFNTKAELRWHISLLCVALAGLFLYDLVLYADAALFRRVSLPLFEGRAAATAIVAPLLAIAAARNRRWEIDIHVSRNVVFHSSTLVLSGIFLLGVAATGEIFRRGGNEWGYVAEVSLVFGAILVIAVLLSSGSARSRLRSAVVDNFFSFRYDYRREWMRCIDLLSAPEAHVGLHTRAIRAIAAVVDSPAGALFVRDPDEVAFRWAGSWNMPAGTEPIPPGHPLIGAFRDGDWIVELDKTPGADRWLAELPRTWLAAPLNQLGQLIGFLVVAQPRAQFKLDREVFDLLRTVSREVASRLAEQRAAQVLAQTSELREYGKRFAFVIHDIKNVSGQLSMLLANAEVHADNPEFQRDMLVTVRASVSRIGRLLARLQVSDRERSHALIAPLDRVRDIAEDFSHTRGVAVGVDDDGQTAGVAMDPDSFDAVVTHLLNNAAEASGQDGPLRIVVRHDALNVLIDIVDRGHGMTPEFVRDELFRPFASTKSGGHGIGAFQARELLREAGGDLLVLSRPDAGTTMRLLLPSVGMAVAEARTLTG